MRKLIAVLLFCAVNLTACGDSKPVITSTLIINAQIHDGSGGEAIRAAVRIDGDRIIEIGDIEVLHGEDLIDARGLVLAPGFIDTHSHHDSDWQEYRHMPGVLSQGVTTIVRGVDGSSEADGEHLPLHDFNTAFERTPTAVNIASFSAHNSIRYAVMGDDSRRPATADEILAMAVLVEADMLNGAIGLATGLEYEPGIFSETEEVIELAKTAARFGGRYMSHVRDEDDLQMDAFDEVIRIGREARLPVHISHIKLADRDYWGTSDAVLDRLNAARGDGVQVSADIYPYQRWASNLAVLFPARDYSDRSVADFTFEHTAAPEDIVLSYFGPNPEFNGLTVAAIASILEKDVATTLMELAQAADDYRKASGHGGGHPRGYGSFPRVLGRFVRDLGVLKLENAIYKMTALPARNVGLEERGNIRIGNYADLVLFDPGTVEDRSTMLDPTALSVGIEKVWVNGVLAFENGESTGVYPGHVVGLGKP
jgi:N-acyl-D-amino-acid deacylase